VEYYQLAVNCSQLKRLKGVMEQSLTKTLAHKLRISVPQVYKRYGTMLETPKGPRKGLQVVVVKAGAIASRLRNDRPEKTNSKEQQSTFCRRTNADRTAPGSADPNADYRTPVDCASVGLRATSS
jgi:hypothetical protein